jgi:hypothetical protein
LFTARDVLPALAYREQKQKTRWRSSRQRVDECFVLQATQGSAGTVRHRGDDGRGDVRGAP